MLECEALTPLRYALPGTRVVLAGDHMQVTPRLFSVARAQAAGHTLLYRLFQLYQQQQAHEAAQRGRLVFHENYRSTEAIIAFVSRHFYVAKGTPILARGKVPRHPHLYPLVFCHVAGDPERDLSLTSWLNAAEVAQVIEQVRQLYDTWPHCWGRPEQRHICVVSHGAQVGPAHCPPHSGSGNLSFPFCTSARRRSSSPRGHVGREPRVPCRGRVCMSGALPIGRVSPGERAEAGAEEEEPGPGVRGQL